MSSFRKKRIASYAEDSTLCQDAKRARVAVNQDKSGNNICFACNSYMSRSSGISSELGGSETSCYSRPLSTDELEDVMTGVKAFGSMSNPVRKVNMDTAITELTFPELINAPLRRTSFDADILLDSNKIKEESLSVWWGTSSEGLVGFIPQPLIRSTKAQSNGNLEMPKENLKGSTFSHADSLGTEMIDLVVGEGVSSRLSRVHKNRLRERIPSLFIGPVDGNKLYLEEASPTIFKLLIEWVYTGNIQLHAKKCENNEGMVINTREDYIEAYVEGDILDIPEFMDAAATAYIDSLQESGEILHMYDYHIFNKTVPTETPLRKFGPLFLYYILNHSAAVKQRDIHWPALNNELRLVMNEELGHGGKELSELVDNMAQDPRAMSRCKFHWHGSEEVCQALTRVTERK